MKAYTENFYNYIDNNAFQGSKQIIPFAMELIKLKSVILFTSTKRHFHTRIILSPNQNYIENHKK